MAVYAGAEGRSFVLCHSALENLYPGKPPNNYDPQDFLFGRPRPDRVYFTEEIPVYGHMPARFLWKQNRIFKTDTLTDIDCGYAFPDGRLGYSRLASE